MAIGDEFSLDLNSSQIYNSIWDSIPQPLMDNFYFLLNLGKIILIFAIIYVIVLIFIKIIGLLFGSKETKMLKSINSKLGEILEIVKRKKGGKEEGDKKGKSSKQ